MQYINDLPIIYILITLVIYLPLRYWYIKTKKRLQVYKEVTNILLIAYTESLIYLTVFPSPHSNPTGEVAVNLVPFQTINRYLVFQGDFVIPLINLLGNVVVFIPIGLFAIIIIQKLSFKTMIVISIASTCVIETTQLILSKYGILSRSFDIDDIILNTMGALMGFLVGGILKKINVTNSD